MNAIATAACAALMLPVVLITAAIAVLTSVLGVGGGSGSQVLPAVALDIPEPMATYYAKAGEQFNIPWPLLAAVGKVECDHNRLRDAHGARVCDHPNSAGAVGPMQFLPATFASYAPLGIDRTQPQPQRRPPSIIDEHDSVFAAAAMLAHDGMPTDPWRALWAYNHSDRYVATVLSWAVRYGYFTNNRVLLGHAVLAHPSLTLRLDAREDVDAGRVDPRVLADLLSLATGHRLDGIGPFTRHSCLVHGTSHLSNHVYGRAVDLFSVDGAAVNVDNAAARTVVGELLALPAPLLPDEIGQPWADLAGLPRAFTDADHTNHVHVGFDSGTGPNALIQTPGCAS